MVISNLRLVPNHSSLSPCQHRKNSLVALMVFEQVMKMKQIWLGMMKLVVVWMMMTMREVVVWMGELLVGRGGSEEVAWPGPRTPPAGGPTANCRPWARGHVPP